MSDIGPTHRALPPRAAAVLLLVLVAVVGAVGGAAIDRVLMRGAGPSLTDTTFHPLSQALRVPTEADRQRLRGELSRTLHLTPAQDSSIDSIMIHRSGEFNALRAELRPRVERLVQDVRSDIEQVLTPEQRVGFRALQQSMSGAGLSLQASGTPPVREP